MRRLRSRSLRGVCLSVFAALLMLSAGMLAAADKTAARKGAEATPADPVVAFINEQVRAAWTDNEVESSEPADDAEWIRRAYLDVVGHIPPAEAVIDFQKNESPAKRMKVIEQLLDDPDYTQNFTSVWRNLLIGRNAPDRTSAAGMEKFLREAFGRNRPWNEVVFDLLTAEGRFDENGAVNFILGQLQLNPRSEDYHVEITAKATKLFLGMQVQCTQCHNHPFNDWKQNQFWEFNSMFRQVRRRDVDKYDPRTGQRQDDYSELLSVPFDGPVYFENRQAVMQVAYPRYFGSDIDPGPDTSRRKELANKMCHEDPGQQMARAYVNRMWGHFFGYGFTRPVDDMGPHNAASHPDLLDRLTEEFVKAGYDSKQLIRWICNSEPYQLTSRVEEKNKIDDPGAGEVPLFSHMYVKTMTVEQLYESLLVATRVDQSGATSYDEAQRQRERWLRQFVQIFGGADDEEPTLFSGSIPQALLMMNGELVQNAISTKQGSYLLKLLNDSKRPSDAALMNQLFEAALGRVATPGELAKLKKHMQGDKLAFYQDLYWALLNSNEFIVNH